MTGSPQVSIITSIYNNEKFLSDTLESVLNQNYNNWEMILIEDKSTDNSLKIIRKYAKKDKRFRIYVQSKNQGLTKNLNFGIRQAKGDYIARIDGDDQWNNKNKLKSQVDFLDQQPGYGLVGTYAYAVDESKKILYEIVYPNEDQEIRSTILRQNCFIHSSVLIRKKTILEAGLYNENLRYSQDYDMWLRIGKISKLFNLKKFYTNYTVNPSGTSVTKYKAQIDAALYGVKGSKHYYPNFYKGFILWSLRKYYPFWLRGDLSIKIKKAINI